MLACRVGVFENHSRRKRDVEVETTRDGEPGMLDPVHPYAGVTGAREGLLRAFVWSAHVMSPSQGGRA